MADNILRDQHDQNRDDGRTDGMPRRRFLACMAWVGTGLVWTLTGGVPSSAILGQAAAGQPGAGTPAPGEFRFVQISDTHIGFKGEANPDVLGTLQLAIDKINALHPAPAFLLHTGNLTHGQKPGAFDTLAEALKSVKASQVFYVPGEHDVLPMLEQRSPPDDPAGVHAGADGGRPFERCKKGAASGGAMARARLLGRAYASTAETNRCVTRENSSCLTRGTE
jgi:calcineurin-like phosphoesterase family protein